MLIPPDQLSKEALVGLIEAFINREGTDYGEQEIPVNIKIEQIKSQLNRGEVVIVFDAASESVNLITAKEYRSLQN